LLLLLSDFGAIDKEIPAISRLLISSMDPILWLVRRMPGKPSQIQIREWDALRIEKIFIPLSGIESFKHQ
jgi:hypothetical protein